MTKARDISDGICAYLQGGFGNQLFILAAAWEQAERLQCPLYVDSSRFIAPDPLERAKETPRPYELGQLSFPGVLLGKDSPWYRNSPRRPAAIRKFGRGSRGLKVFRQPTLNYHAEVQSVTPGTTMLGYFQSWRYFESVQEKLASALLNAELSDSERTELATFTEDTSVSAHVRRGDYLTPEAAFHHGIASSAYFARALHLLRQIPGVPAQTYVFSDSPDLVQKELSGTTDLTFVEDTTKLSSLGTVLAMSRGSAFAMSNSSFSWWAAWLMSRRNPDAPVVAPRPWIANGQSGHDQLLPSWITLDAR